MLVLFLASLLPAPSAAIEVRAAMRLVTQGAGPATVAVLAVNRSNASSDAEVRFRFDAGTVEPQSQAIHLGPHEWRPVIARCTLRDAADAGTVQASVGGAGVSVDVVRGIDLTSLEWRRAFAPREAPAATHLADPSLDDSGWPILRVPALWGDNRHAWCRVRFTVPEEWRGKPVRLYMGAVDDNDVTYLNGSEIGRTNGWDTSRTYDLPQDRIRWGAENVITVMVDNPTFGGGLHKGPILVLAGDAPTEPRAKGQEPRAESQEPRAKRPPPGRVGKPRPLRPMVVKDGVLRYGDGSEVALWGVNIYPQSWYQFDTMKKLGVDMRATVIADFDHLQQMGVEAIRIHVFDREISDGSGNILDNEHLELLDLVISECSRRGIYLYFTPIAWWGGPNENKASFSAQTSKPGMMFVPSAVDAAARYLAQFLNRKNRFTDRAVKDEPSLCVLEVMNEPTYFLYGDLAGEAYVAQGEPADVLNRDRAVLRRQWEDWLISIKSEPSSELFPLFRYDQMRRYIRRMVEAIRSTGAKQPIAISYFGVNGDDIAQAIADSECDAVTFSNYPGGWERVNDGRNLLYAAAPMDVDSRLVGKARLAYEFDTPATNVSCYMFPALAAHFRSGEVQIACQFQYDSVSTARWNTDWNAHWLNWLYTPTKAVSFMIGGQAFRSLPRGVSFDVGDWRKSAGSLKIGGMAVSFDLNNSVFVSPGTAMYARSPAAMSDVDWPAEPTRIVGTGTSRYVEYGGTGAYVLERTGPNRMRLTLNPDARLVGNSLVGSLDAPVAELENSQHPFRIKLQGWERARCSGKGGVEKEVHAGGWLLKPGVYEIVRSRRL